MNNKLLMIMGLTTLLILGITTTHVFIKNNNDNNTILNDDGNLIGCAQLDFKPDLFVSNKCAFAVQVQFSVYIVAGVYQKYDTACLEYGQGEQVGIQVPKSDPYQFNVVKCSIF